MKRFSIAVPLVGEAHLEVLAHNKEEARELALTYGACPKDTAIKEGKLASGAHIDYIEVMGLDPLEKMASGNVGHYSLSEMAIQEDPK